MTKKNESFKDKLFETLNKAVLDLFTQIQDENIYALSLYTSGEDDYSYICVSANTEEDLIEKAHLYATEDVGVNENAAIKSLRWSVPDWKYHNFSSEIESLTLPDDLGPKRDLKLYNDFVSCIKKVKKNVLFENRNIVFLITCGDMSDDFLIKGLKKLNSNEVINRYLEEYTALPFINYLRSLPIISQIEKVINLYCDLWLYTNTEMCIEARTRNVTQFDLEPLIIEYGPQIAPKLLDIIEANGFKPIFYEKSSDEFKKHGAFTLENELATSCTFLIEEYRKIDDSQIERMQKIIKKRIEIDTNLEITSTLAENLARVLHKLRPNKFPDTVMSSKTNHLENYKEYLL